MSPKGVFINCLLPGHYYAALTAYLLYGCCCGVFIDCLLYDHYSHALITIWQSETGIILAARQI